MNLANNRDQMLTITTNILSLRDPISSCPLFIKTTITQIREFSSILQSIPKVTSQNTFIASRQQLAENWNTVGADFLIEWELN